MRAKLFYRLGVRPLCRDRRRSTLSVLGVGLGVALLFSVNLATSRARTDIREGEGFRNRASLEIVSRYGERIPDDVYASLLRRPGSDLEFLPIVSAYVELGSRGNSALLVGVDLLKFPYFLGGYEDEPPGGRDVPALDERVLIVSNDTLGDLGLQGRTRVLIRGGTGTETGEVGVYGGSWQDPGGDGSLLVGDIAWVRPFLGMTGTLTSILVRVRAGDVDDIQRELQKAVPPDLLVQRPADRILRTGEVIRAFDYNLRALSLMALLVGMFLVYNTVAVSAVRRRTEIGVLRALGMRRTQVVLLFLAEAGTIGLTGSVLGVVVGGIMAETVSAGINATLRTLYDVVVGPVARLPLSRAAVPLVWGTAGAVLAGLLPALEGSRAVPAETVREGAFEVHGDAGFGGRAAVGAVLVAAGMGIALFLKVSRFPFAGFAGILVLTAGFVLGTAWVVRISGAAAVAPLSRVAGAAGRLAGRGVAGRPRRTGMAVASIGISLGCAIGILLLTYSFRTTVERWITGNLSADVYLKPASCEGKVFCDDTVPKEVIEQLGSVKGLKDVYAFRGAPFTFRGKKTHIGFSDVALLRKYGRMEFASRRPRDEIFEDVLNGTAVLVSEPFAYRFDVEEGDVIGIPGRRGEISFRVGAVYRDYATELGYVILDRRFLKPVLGTDDAHTIGLYFDREEPPALIRRRVEAIAEPGKLFFLETAGLRAAVLGVFDRTFAVTQGIYLLALGIALLGVVSTFFTLVLDRRRELAVLRFLGMARRDIFRMLLLETSIVAAIGCLLGVVFGAILGVLLVFVVNKQSFGWSVEFVVPWLPVARMVLLMALASVFSAWWPYRGAVRFRPADSVGRE